jgi:release factor glutamine methyltransferase
MTSNRTEELLFDGLSIRFDGRLLRPRAWTEEQARWAADLLPELPPGPVLELCSGAAQIGLAAIQHSDRRLVCVDASAAAIEQGTANARAAGMTGQVEFREGHVADVLLREETFSLVIADPPWVPSADVSRYPEDPRTAIDGGADGLDVARVCLRVIEDHLMAGGAALLQLGTVDQVARLMSLGDRTVRCLETRQYERGVVARLGRSADDP